MADPSNRSPFSRVPGARLVSSLDIPRRVAQVGLKAIGDAMDHRQQAGGRAPARGGRTGRTSSVGVVGVRPPGTRAASAVARSGLVSRVKTARGENRLADGRSGFRTGTVRVPRENR